MKPKPALRSLTVRLELEDFERIEALAQDEKRPVANLARLLISEGAARRLNRGTAAAA